MPVLAGIVGGSASEAGSAILAGASRFGTAAVEDIMSSFPSLSLEPAYAGGFSTSVAGAIARTAVRAAAAIGSVEGAAAMGANMLAMSSMHDYERSKELFVGGRVPAARKPEGPSVIKNLKLAFKNSEIHLNGKPKVDVGIWNWKTLVTAVFLPQSKMAKKPAQELSIKKETRHSLWILVMDNRLTKSRFTILNKRTTILDERNKIPSSVTQTSVEACHSRTMGLNFGIDWVID